jgi:hypothetical protein
MNGVLSKGKHVKLLRAFVIFIGCILLIITFSCAPKRIGFSNGRFAVKGQELFMSGMNLAWMSFGRDITDFNEEKFVKALEDVALEGGNCIRWWIHVNGSTSPLFDKAGMTAVLPPGFTDTLKHALDLARERGIMVVVCLWSFDMLKSNTGVNLDANQLMIENRDYTMAYVNKALRPLVKSLKGHPAILCWEVINEPEGMLSAGWTERRTDMKNVRRFINLIAGGVHAEDPDALVTVGTGLAMNAQTGGLVNNYADSLLIAAGGDRLGTLDFYEAHYYPQNEDEVTSPFHHPASYWKLDKPILIGEFPAFGIREFGKGFRPKTALSAEESYVYAFDNGYAGALAWTWTAHDGFGGIDDAAPGMLYLQKKFPENINIKSDVNRPPMVFKKIENLIVKPDTKETKSVINLMDYFTDYEDGKNLKFSVGKISKPDVLSAQTDATGELTITIPAKSAGTCKVEVTAEDTGGKKRSYQFIVFVYDPARGNLALFKTVTAQSSEGESTLAKYVNDGLDDTRWSSAWADDQWMVIDLRNVFTVKRLMLNWEVAFGSEYEILVSTDNVNWNTVVVEKNGKGKIEEKTIPPVAARYVKLHGTKRATEWGFSLWEFEVYGAD